MRTLKHSVDYLNLFSKEIDQVTSPIQLLNDLLHEGIDGVSLPALLKSINDEKNEQLLNEFLRQLNNKLPEGQKIEVSANKEAIKGAVESYVHEQIRTRLNRLVEEKLFNLLEKTLEPEDVLFLQLVTSPNNRLGALIQPNLRKVPKKDFDSTIIPASISDPLLNSLLLNQGATPIDQDQVSITHTIEYMAASWMEKDSKDSKDSTAIATQSDDPFLSFVDTSPEIVKYLPEQTQKKLKEIKKSSEIGKIEETEEKESNNNYDVAQLWSSWWSGGRPAAYSSSTIATKPKSKDKHKNHSSSAGSLKKTIGVFAVGLLLWGFNSYSSSYPSAKVVMRDKPQLLSTTDILTKSMSSYSDSPTPSLQAVALYANSGSRLFHQAPFYHTIQPSNPEFGIVPYQFKSLAYPLYSVPRVFSANPPPRESDTQTTSKKPDRVAVDQNNGVPIVPSVKKSAAVIPTKDNTDLTTLISYVLAPKLEKDKQQNFFLLKHGTDWMLSASMPGGDIFQMHLSNDQVSKVIDFLCSIKQPALFKYIEYTNGGYQEIGKTTISRGESSSYVPDYKPTEKPNVLSSAELPLLLKDGVSTLANDPSKVDLDPASIPSFASQPRAPSLEVPSSLQLSLTDTGLTQKPSVNLLSPATEIVAIKSPVNDQAAGLALTTDFTPATIEIIDGGQNISVKTSEGVAYSFTIDEVMNQDSSVVSYPPSERQQVMMDLNAYLKDKPTVLTAASSIIGEALGTQPQVSDKASFNYGLSDSTISTFTFSSSADPSSISTGQESQSLFLSSQRSSQYPTSESSRITDSYQSGDRYEAVDQPPALAASTGDIDIAKLIRTFFPKTLKKDSAINILCINDGEQGWRVIPSASNSTFILTKDMFEQAISVLTRQGTPASLIFAQHMPNDEGSLILTDKMNILSPGVVNNISLQQIVPSSMLELRASLLTSADKSSSASNQAQDNTGLNPNSDSTKEHPAEANTGAVAAATLATLATAAVAASKQAQPSTNADQNSSTSPTVIITADNEAGPNPSTAAAESNLTFLQEIYNALEKAQKAFPRKELLFEVESGFLSKPTSDSFTINITSPGSKNPLSLSDRLAYSAIHDMRVSATTNPPAIINTIPTSSLNDQQQQALVRIFEVQAQALRQHFPHTGDLKAKITFSVTDFSKDEAHLQNILKGLKASGLKVDEKHFDTAITYSSSISQTEKDNIKNKINELIKMHNKDILSKNTPQH